MQAKLPTSCPCLRIFVAGWVKGIEARRNFKKRKDLVRTMRSVEDVLACDVVGRLLRVCFVWPRSCRTWS